LRRWPPRLQTSSALDVGSLCQTPDWTSASTFAFSTRAPLVTMEKRANYDRTRASFARCRRCREEAIPIRSGAHGPRTPSIESLARELVISFGTRRRGERRPRFVGGRAASSSPNGDLLVVSDELAAKSGMPASTTRDFSRKETSPALAREVISKGAHEAPLRSHAWESRPLGCGSWFMTPHIRSRVRIGP